MRIRDLVKRLKEIYDDHGDLRVRVVDAEGWWGMAVLDITSDPEPDSLADTV